MDFGAIYREAFSHDDYNRHTADEPRYVWALQAALLQAWAVRGSGRPDDRLIWVDVGSGRGGMLRLIREAEIPTVTFSVDVEKFHDELHCVMLLLDLADPETPAKLQRLCPQADLLVCLDVLEHLPENAIEPLLRAFATISRRVVTSVANHPESPYGTELHLTRWSKEQWDEVFRRHFEIEDSRVEAPNPESNPSFLYRLIRKDVP